MNKLSLIILLASTAAVGTAAAQDITSATAKELIPVVRLADNISVRFGGFIRAEYYIDSREMVGAVDDLFGFFPEPKRLGADGKDLNAVVRQNFSTQASRFSALLAGPDFLKARSSAYFEYDFTGGGTVNLRLRHAWVKLTWPQTELLLGKTWNPMAETPFPSVAGLHTGIPFRPFGRSDQIRVVYKPGGDFSILAAAVYQSEHKTALDPSLEGDVRANPMPEAHLQLHYKTPAFSAGLLSEFKVIRPATQTTGTDGTFKATKTLSSYAFGVYADYTEGLFNMKGSAIYGQNLSELFQQGGYAVRTQDPATGARTYTPSTSTSAWINLTYGRQWVGGIFAGYQKNLGFNDPLLPGGTFYGRWQNVDHIYRIGPSLKYSYKQWCVHAEVDYNVAAYGTVDYTDKGKVRDAASVGGVRGVLATTFYF